jgi:geranylgeranyl transferase type-2 subunit beta
VNSPLTYLQSLTTRLAAGLESVPAEARARHAEFLLTSQRADGGFAGREGDSDLYYTSFALRSLAILGELYGPVAERAADFLRQRLGTRETLIDRISLVFGAAQLDAAAGIDIWTDAGQDWRAALADELGALRRPDGGFAKGAEGTASSTYHTFLALLCLELLNCPITDPDNIVQFIKSQQATSGGFREIRVSKRAGTNPTAAAVGVLRMLNALDPDVAQSTAEFVSEMQDDDGGLLANSRIPLADLLSTFTGLVTLADLERADVLDADVVIRFVESLSHPAGGFRAAVWDEMRDVEYTFYGLGCLALLLPSVP